MHSTKLVMESAVIPNDALNIDQNFVSSDAKKLFLKFLNSDGKKQFLNYIKNPHKLFPAVFACANQKSHKLMV